MKRKQHALINAFVALISAFFISTAQSHSQSLPYWDVPIFQYEVFYNLNLEIDPGATIPIEGSVFSNAGIWSGSANSTYFSTVWAEGQINTSGTDPYCTGKVDSGTPASSFYYRQPVSGVAPAILFNLSKITNAEAIIEIPPSSLAAPQSIAYEATNQVYAFNAASLIVSNWDYGINGITPWSNNFTVYLQDSALGLPFAIGANWVQLTNDFYIYSNSFTHQLFTTNQVPNFRFTSNVSTIQWTNNPTGTNSVWYAGFSFLTNVTFYDYREQATVQAVQVDVGKLGAWITNAAVNGGSNWNEGLFTDTAHGIDSIFVDNTVPFIGQQQLPAVRLVNGEQLPTSTWHFFGSTGPQTSGLTVATPQPLYVLGNYNVQTNGGPVVLNSHTVVNTYPAALMADAITILSGNWSDAYNVTTSLGSRIWANTTVNAACLEGIVPSSGANYSGGVENFVRLLENGVGGILTYNGSIAVMFPSIYATNAWPGTGSVYNVPARNWAFDTNFYLLQDLPPLTPFIINSNTTPIITVQPANEAVLAGQSTNFNITVTGMPAISYQWVFDGTNISGATNTSLPLAGIQLTNAGDYAVQVSNVLGSVISSNALLSVYTSAAPVLNALSFSISNGVQFTVSGVPGFNYAVQTSTNLIDWWPLTTNNSPFDFIDTNSDFPERFYRSIYLP